MLTALSTSVSLAGCRSHHTNTGRGTPSSEQDASRRAYGRSARSKVVRHLIAIGHQTDGVAILNLTLSLHSALKEFFDPLRTNNSRADFFSVYRRESDEFDREYTKKYDEDLNTTLIFVSYPISFLRAGH